MIHKIELLCSHIYLSDKEKSLSFVLTIGQFYKRKRKTFSMIECEWTAEKTIQDVQMDRINNLSIVKIDTDQCGLDRNQGKLLLFFY